MATPRVKFASMSNYVNQTVRIVGTVTTREDTYVQITDPHGAHITILTSNVRVGVSCAPVGAEDECPRGGPTMLKCC